MKVRVNMRMNAVNKDTSGVTLLEVVLAMLVLGMVIPALWHLLSQSQTAVRVARGELEVLNIGAAAVRQVRAIPANKLVAMNDETELDLPDHLGWTTIRGNHRLSLPWWEKDRIKVTYRIESVTLPPLQPGVPAPIGKVVVFRIRWTETQGGEREHLFLGTSFPGYG